MAKRRSDSGAGAPVLVWMIAAVYLALIVPVYLVDAPPLLDYSNHNARLWMVAGGGGGTPLERMYAIDWSNTSTTIGIDLIAALAGPVIGKTQVGPLCLALSILLPALGALLLNRRAFGGAHWWQLTLVLPAFGKLVLSGMMNFNIGIGVAFIGGALDAPLARRGPVLAFVGRLLIAILTLVIHPFALMCYGGVVLGLFLGREAGPLLSWRGLRDRALPGLRVVAPTLVALGLMFGLAPHLPGHLGAEHTVVAWEAFTPRNILAMLITAFHSYVDAYDLAVVALLIAVAGVALALRRISIHAGLLLAGLAFTAVALVMPSTIGDAYWLQFRLPTMAAFILLASIRPDFATSTRARMLMAGLFFLLALSRTGVVAAAWISEQSDIRAVRRALESVPHGSKLLPLRNEASAEDRRKAPFGRYFGAVEAFGGYGEMAVIQRHAFVPMVFGIVGQQPLVTLGDYEPLTQPWGGQPARVSEIDLSPQPPSRRYLRQWRRDFDYILLLNSDVEDKDGRRLSAADAELVADTGFAEVYRVRHEGAEAMNPAP
jgi:hypothetical protein